MKTITVSFLWFNKLQCLVNRYHYDNSNRKTLKLIKAEFLRDLDLLLKSQHEQHKVWCLADNLHEQ